MRNAVCTVPAMALVPRPFGASPNQLPVVSDSPLRRCTFRRVTAVQATAAKPAGYEVACMFPDRQRPCRSATSIAPGRSAPRAPIRASSAPTRTKDRARKAPARRSVSRVLSRPCGAGTVIHLRRRLPDVFSGRPESEATPLLPDLRPTALLFGLAPGRACPFHPAPFGFPNAAGSSLWRWSSPLGGRVLPATLRRGARTFLVSINGFPMGHATVRPSRWPDRFYIWVRARPHSRHTRDRSRWGERWQRQA